MDSNHYAIQVHQYMITRVPEETSAIAKTFADGITSDALKLVDLVQFLGEYLTDDNGDTRSSAVSCIASTLSALPKEKLTRSQITVILNFLCDRLDDTDSIKPVLSGLVALVSMNAFSTTLVADLLENIKSKTTPRQYSQVSRHSIFTILDLIYSRFPNFVESSPDLFIPTFIHTTSGEKDPRNLIKSFTLSSKILSSTRFIEQNSLDKYDSKLFDVSFCYFPITFEPPKNDPYGITSADLKTALRNTLSANGIFAQHIFSSLMDKMASSSLKVKADSLDTIVACIDAYNPSYVSSLWRDIWDGLKFEILHGTETDTQAQTSAALCGLAKSLEKYAETDPAPLDAYLAAITAETKEQILDTTNKKSLPAAALAAAIAQASPQVFSKISSESLAPALANSSKPQTLTAQKHLLLISKTFILAAKGMDSLDPFKDSFIEFFTKSLMSTTETETEVRVLAVDNLSLLLSMPDYLTSDEVGLIVQYFNEIIVSTLDNKLLTDVILDSLVQIAKLYEQAILSISYPFFLSKLPDSDALEEDQVLITTILRALSRMAASRPIFEVLHVRLLNKLDAVVQSSSPSYPLAIFSALASVLKLLLQSQPQDAAIYIKKFIPSVFSKFFKNGSPLLANDHVIISGALSLLYVSSALKDNEQQQVELVQNLFNLFWFAQPSKLVSSEPKKLLSEKSSLVTFFLYGLIPISPKVKLPENIAEALPAIVTELVSVLPTTTSKPVRLAYLRLVCTAFNKWIPGNSEFTTELVASLKSAVTAAESSKAVRLNSLEVLFWVTKAYLLRADALGFKLVEYILELLKSPTVGMPASRLTEVLVSDDGLLNKDNGAVVRLLYKQRLFVTAIEPLVSGFEVSAKAAAGDGTSSADELFQVKVNHLVALSSILRHMPSNVLSSHIPKFFKLLLQSLTIPDARVREASINTITATLTTGSAAGTPAEPSAVAGTISEHLSTLVPLLLDATDSGKEPAPQVRVAALRCLDTFIDTVPRLRLVPHVQTVQKRLCVPLDDDRRGVRRVAVSTRQKYFELEMQDEE